MSAADHIFSIHQILEKKWEYNVAVHQLFVDFKKAYDLVRRKVFYNVLIEFGIPTKLARLIKILGECCKPYSIHLVHITTTVHSNGRWLPIICSTSQYNFYTCIN